MPLTDEDKQRIREEELFRIQVRNESRHRNLTTVVIGATSVGVVVLMLAFSILRTV